MHFVFVILIICLLIFLYSLHLLAEDDFVIMRKNATVEKIFNATFITVLVSLFTSRLLYVLLNPKKVFFEPLGFIVFPYFPGLSLMGGIIGGAIFFFFYARYAKLPTGRIFDFLAASFIAGAPIGAVGVMLLTLSFKPSYLFQLLVYAALFAVTVFYFKKGAKLLKDGSFGLLILLLVSFTSLIASALDSFKGLNFFLMKEAPIMFITMALAVILLIKNEWSRLSRLNERH